ncbi:hypothetical protein DH2020_008468 [Rehmannia glutinosa]|uniref:Uncharacterized protein n=1 Tax=Rehmannia glutinosa TaxID=99300 RepID=A0ABR0X433_REHGL
MVCAEIAKEMIKPSSPTPPHLRKLQLSFLDQLAPPIYIHIILYFQPSHHHHHEYSKFETSQKLKQSLSDALSIYYPLAGRIRDNSWVDCNDDGAEYIEARFNNGRILNDVVENPQIDELRQYVPATPSGGGDIPMAVQVSFFGCGGTAIGVCMSHKVADAMSFINAWAAACRGDAKTISVTQPTFNLASRFPPADFSGFFSSGPLSPPQKILTKRFVFNKWKLAALRKAASGPLMEIPTRVEAVSAFIWRHFIEAVALKDTMNGENTVFATTHAVDIRSRASPHLPHQFFGNACARAMAMTEEKRDYYDLAMKLREVIRKADADYVRLEDGDTFLKYYSCNEENDPMFKDGRKNLEICSFTSWYRLPAYEADYGWGKPDWVSIIGVPQKNLVFFLGTKTGDGIEAWVNMLEEDIAIIETNYHLLHQVENIHFKSMFSQNIFPKRLQGNSTKLSDVVENPRTEELKKYVRATPSGSADIPLAVQVNFFGCSGTAIGVCVSHRLADAMSMVTFINAWAAACRGDSKTIAVTQPTFNLASRFPRWIFPGYSRRDHPAPSKNRDEKVCVQ